MKEILNHTCYDYNWENQIKKYDYNRTHLKWGKNPYPEQITHKMVKQNDLTFNPILQKYNDNEYDKQLRQKEKSDIYTTIIKKISCAGFFYNIGLYFIGRHFLFDRLLTAGYAL